MPGATWIRILSPRVSTVSGGNRRARRREVGLQSTTQHAGECLRNQAAPTKPSLLAALKQMNPPMALY